MPLWAIACAVFFGAVTGVTGLAAAVSAFRFFHRSGHVAGSLEPRVIELEQASEFLALRGEQLALTQARLAGSQQVLDASVTKLRALSWALEDVRFLVGAVRAVIPTK